VMSPRLLEVLNVSWPSHASRKRTGINTRKISRMERARSNSSFGSHPCTICPVLKMKSRALQAALPMSPSLESKLRAARRLF
ncbi:unnamed protein product, partial [Aphanomyces euteiches]